MYHFLTGLAILPEMHACMHEYMVLDTLYISHMYTRVLICELELWEYNYFCLVNFLPRHFAMSSHFHILLLIYYYYIRNIDTLV